MFNSIKKCAVAQLMIASGLSLALAGCAVESIPYPTLSTPKKLTKRLLSRDEQEAAIRDLSAEQARHKDSAITAIEKMP